MIHYIHHIRWSFGYKLAFIPLAYFKKHGLKWVKKSQYHNCTTTGVY